LTCVVGKKRDEILSAVSPKRKEGRLFLALGFFGMLLPGFFAVTVHYPAWQTAKSIGDWSAVPCLIEETAVEKTTHRHESTYKPTVKYAYEFRGRKYRSKQTHISTMEPEDLVTTRQFLSLYTPGTVATCYVNPAKPYEAVLDRNYSFVKSAGSLLFLAPLYVGFIIWDIHKVVRARRELVPSEPQAEMCKTTVNPRPSSVTLSPPEVGWGGRILSFLLMGASGAVLYWIVSNCLQTRRVLGQLDVSALQFIGATFGFVLFCAGAVLCWKTFDPYPVVN
jgi:Protein of unknown function (DUF3592)